MLSAFLFLFLFRFLGRLHQAVRLKKLLPVKDLHGRPEEGEEVEPAVAVEDEELVVETSGDPEETQEEKG